jgi:hypothetical protein
MQSEVSRCRLAGEKEGVNKDQAMTARPNFTTLCRIFTGGEIPGVATATNYCCRTCGHYEMGQLFDKLRIQPKAKRYAFFTEQEEQKVKEGHHLVYVCHDSESTAEIVVNYLRDAGFGVTWSGRGSDCVIVQVGSPAKGHLPGEPLDPGVITELLGEVRREEEIPPEKGVTLIGVRRVLESGATRAELKRYIRDQVRADNPLFPQIDPAALPFNVDSQRN